MQEILGTLRAYQITGFLIVTKNINQKNLWHTNLYTAVATATGGRDGHVESSDGIVPREMGGPGKPRAMSHSVRSMRSPPTTRAGRLIPCQDFNSQSSSMYTFLVSTRQRHKGSLNRRIKSVRIRGRLGTILRSNSPSCRPFSRSKRV